MKTKLINNEIAELYKNRTLNREQLADKYGKAESDINKILYNNHIDLWDLKRDYNVLDIVNLYKKKLMNRKQICEKYNITLGHITNCLYHYNVKIWDYMRKPRKVYKKKNNKKYFNWEEFKGHIILSYNDQVFRKCGS